MLLKLFTIYDTKAVAFLQPFFFPQVGQAIRAFTTEANDSRSMIGRHPGDYILYMMGVFDDATGSYIPELQPVNLGPASQFVEPPQARSTLFDMPPPSVPPKPMSPTEINTLHEELLARTRKGPANGGAQAVPHNHNIQGE